MNEKKRDYDIKYMREKCRMVRLQLNRENDKDIVEHLESKDNINAYLKELIRKDMK